MDKTVFLNRIYVNQADKGICANYYFMSSNNKDRKATLTNSGIAFVSFQQQYPEVIKRAG